MELSDEDLYERSRKGDREALAALYDRREPALYRYALQLSGSRALAEEAVHEAFLLLIEARARFEPGKGSLEAFLHGVVRNRVRMALRAGPVEAREEQAAEDDVLGTLIADEAASKLYAAIRELPERYREVVVLCDLDERSYDDAARLIGCPVGTVRSRLYRARRLLAAKLGPPPPAEGGAK